MIRGWRRYKAEQINGAWTLVGMKMDWPSAEMQAECIGGPTVNTYGDAYWIDASDVRDSVPEDELVLRDTPEGRRQLYSLHMTQDDACARWHAGSFTCGIYVVPERDRLKAVTHDHGQVEAAVIGWGITGVYDVGWRCQYVRIDHIELIPPLSESAKAEEILSALCERYKV